MISGESGRRRRISGGIESPESDLGVGGTVVKESTDLGGDVRVRASTVFTSYANI